MKKTLSRGNHIPNEDDVVRHIHHKKIAFNDDGKIIGIFPQAFELRPNESTLSVSWLDCFAGTKEEKLKQTLASLEKVLDVGSKNGMAIASVGLLKDIAKQQSEIELRVAYAPTKLDIAHSEIHHLKRDDVALAEIMASDIFKIVKQVKDI
jgi:hypothetical protein